MANYNAEKLESLIAKIKATPDKINQYLSDTVNAGATYARNESVDLISRRVALQPNYVKQRLNITKRASPSNPTSVIRGVERGTLLTRYPFVVSKEGVKVKVSQKGGFNTISSAFKVTGLRGSFATGIAINNKVYYDFYKLLPQDTPGKRNKLAQLKNKAETKPRGIHVLHAPSIDQLFNNAKDDIEPLVLAFMTKNFLARLNK